MAEQIFLDRKVFVNGKTSQTGMTSKLDLNSWVQDVVNDSSISGTTILAEDGAVGTPSISFASDTDTGFYWLSAGTMGIVANGNVQAMITTNGLVVSNPLDVGQINASYTNGTLFTNITDATNKDTGSIVTNGGIGVEKAIFAGGKITTSDATASTSTTSGALIVAGGVGIAKELFVSTTTPFSVSATGVVTVTNATDSTTKDTGSVILEGGMGIEKSLVVGLQTTTGFLQVQNAAEFLSNIGTFGEISSSHISLGGALTLKKASASKAMAGGGTEVITLSIPAGVVLVATQLRNDTILTATTGVSYSAAYSGGSTAAISSGTAFAKNTKVNTFFDANAATAITSNTTNITLIPDAGTLDTGTVTAVVYYYSLTPITDAV